MADFVQHLKTNLKGDMDVELSPCTLLVGKSGAGKSAIVDATSLAARGIAHSKGLGKDPKRLIGLAPEGSDELYSKAVLSSGEVLSWKTKGANKTTLWQVDSEDITESPVLFVSEVAEALMFGDSKRIQQAMITATGAEIASHKILKDLPGEMHVELERILVEELGMAPWEKQANKTTKPPDAFTPQQITAALKAIASLKQKNNQRLKVLGTEGGSGESFPLSDEEKEEVKKLSALEAQSKGSQDPDALSERIEECEGAIKFKLHRMKELSPKGAEFLQKRRDVLSLLQAVQTLQRKLKPRYEGKETAKCTACASTIQVKGYVDYCEKVDGLVESVAKDVELNATSRNEWLSLRDAVATLKESRRAYVKSLEGAQPTESFDRELLVALKQRARQDRNAQASSETLPLLEQANTEYDAIKEVLEAQLGLMTDQAAAVTEKKLNQFLPKSIRAKISVQGGKKSSVSIMVSMQSGPFRDFRMLSGAQRATLITAVASVTIPPDAPPVRVMVIDELLIDSTAFRNLMNATTRAINRGGGFTQAIFCAVSWGGKAPAGWSMVKIERAKDAQEATLTQA